MKLRSHIIVLLGCISSIAFGQSPPPDTSGLPLSTISIYEGLFSKQWTDKFIDAWGAIPESARVLKGMGLVRFTSLGKDSTSTIINFDSTGKASLLSGLSSSRGATIITGTALAPGDSIPTFTAKLERWAEFMEGKFNAVAGVLQRKISYKGPFTLAIKYGFQFNKVAPVGKHIAEALHKK